MRKNKTKPRQKWVKEKIKKNILKRRNRKEKKFQKKNKEEKKINNK
jgi:hypothetical protein